MRPLQVMDSLSHPALILVEFCFRYWGPGLPDGQVAGVYGCDSLPQWPSQRQAACMLFLDKNFALQVMDSLSHPALLLVDGVSSIGGLDFQMDAWKVDMAVTGSQKALSMPTGLAVVAASPKVKFKAKKFKPSHVLYAISLFTEPLHLRGCNAALKLR